MIIKVKIILKTIFLVFLSFNLFDGQREFCNGFNAGFDHGYVNSHPNSPFGPTFKPFCPISKIPALKDAFSKKNDFQYGYEIGYQQGLRAR